MSGIMERVSKLFEAHTNDLLSKAEQKASLPMLNQRARDFQQAVREMNDQASITKAGIVTKRRQSDVLDGQITAATAVAKKLAVSTDPTAKTLALAKATTILDLTKRKKALDQQIADQTLASAGLEAQLSKLNAKLAETMTQIHDFAQMHDDAESKAKVTNAMEHISSLVTAPDIDIDSIETHLQSQHDIQDARFQRAMESMDAGDSDHDNSEAEALLASLTPAAAPSAQVAEAAE